MTPYHAAPLGYLVLAPVHLHLIPWRDLGSALVTPRICHVDVSTREHLMQIHSRKHKPKDIWFPRIKIVHAVNMFFHDWVTARGSTQPTLPSLYQSCGWFSIRNNTSSPDGVLARCFHEHRLNNISYTALHILPTPTEYKLCVEWG